MTDSSIERARRYTAKCAPAISGKRGHDTAFSVATALVHGFALDIPTAMLVFKDWNSTCVPPWNDNDLLHKLTSASSALHTRPRGHLLRRRTEIPTSTGGNDAGVRRMAPPPPKPRFSPDHLRRVAANTRAVHSPVDFLLARSVVATEGLTSTDFLGYLYPPATREKVLLFERLESQGQLLWRAEEANGLSTGHLPQGPDGVWFLPQPVDGLYHANPRAGGRLSRRSEESVTDWRYAVLESDEAPADDWLRCLIQIPLPIASICESGGRSIHALVRIDAASKSDWEAQIAPIKPILVTLGADPVALSAVRLTRLPQARRGDRIQRLLYLNPKPDEMPIIQRPPRKVQIDIHP